MESEKKYKIRNSSGVSAYEKEYYQLYASKKTKDIYHCDCCNKDLSYYAKSKHLRSIKHLKNLSS